MSSRFLIIAVLMSATVAQAQDDDRHPVAENNNWSIMDSDCSIDAEWADGKGVVVSLHEGHYDLEVYYPKFKGVIGEKVIPVKIGAGEHFADAKTYDVLGYNVPENKSYTAGITDDLLDRIAESNALQLYRGNILLADLDVSGFREAFTKLKSCEAEKNDAAALAADDAMASDSYAEGMSDAAADAAAAAAEAVDNAAVDAMKPQ
ncbi:hypothetical protein [Parasphingorhabdus halotolerans]|uniref:KTSC domain-containing protein n=1 Tax=Parasphingorhabdus halotolerans TaxID=2725558 RepID=A0A6H2DJK7_9SPHN|nr:hypothetical protein [Parasphingorhabdus halotolerans]QJB68378.1 hypothetical protein HF685_02880 [Parasphingorhabdus halotolerans]